MLITQISQEQLVSTGSSSKHVEVGKGWPALSFTCNEYQQLRAEQLKWLEENSQAIDLDRQGEKVKVAAYFQPSEFWRPLTPAEPITTSPQAFFFFLQLLAEASACCEKETAFRFIELLYEGYSRALPKGSLTLSFQQKYRAEYDGQKRELRLLVYSELRSQLIGEQGAVVKNAEAFLKSLIDANISIHAYHRF